MYKMGWSTGAILGFLFTIAALRKCLQDTNNRTNKAKIKPPENVKLVLRRETYEWGGTAVMRNPAAAAVAGRLPAPLAPTAVERHHTQLIFTGVPKSRFFSATDKSRVLGGVFQSPAVCSQRVANMGSEVQAGVVLPASLVYAEEAIRAMNDGRVVAVPTDTLYGFACDACSPEAVNSIYEIKGRKHTSPLAICVADVADISRFAVVNHLPDGLLDCLLPGPVTVVLRRGDSSILEKSLNPGMDSIGVRVPDYKFIRAVARGCGRALALTSANLSGQPSSVSIKDFENLWQHCAFVFDDGLLPSGRAGSTVVDLLTPRRYKILRPGSAKEETIAILKRFNLEEAY